jgi:hypothetical protein
MSKNNMAKSKKSSKKLKLNINAANFERNLMFVLLVAFLVCAGWLLVRNNQNSGKAEVGEPQPVIEAPQE